MLKDISYFAKNSALACALCYFRHMSDTQTAKKLVPSQTCTLWKKLYAGVRPASSDKCFLEPDIFYQKMSAKRGIILCENTLII